MKRLIETFLFEEVDEDADPQEIGNTIIKKLTQQGDLLHEISNVLPEALSAISNNWDEITACLIKGCMEPGQKPIEEMDDFIDSLTMPDVVALREVCLELNDLKEYAVAEGNSVAGVFSSMIQSTSAGTKNESSQDGGQAGNTSSLAAASA